MSETLTEKPQPDVVKSAEVYQGDINNAIIKAQQMTGPEIDEAWWNQHVGNNGSNESILERFDVAYVSKVAEEQSVSKEDNQLPLENNDSSSSEKAMRIQTQKEEAAWGEYISIGSKDYLEANRDRINSGKLDVTNLGTAEHSLTLVASLRVDPETKQVVSGHEDNPEAQSIADTEEAFQLYLDRTEPDKRVVVYEGDERIFSDRAEAIRQASDSGLIQFLAKQESVPSETGEPTKQEVSRIMAELGVSSEELAALYVGRALASLKNPEDPNALAGHIYYEAAVAGVEGFHEYSEAEKNTIVENDKLDEAMTDINSKVQELLPKLNEMYRPALDGEDLFVVNDGKVVLNPVFADSDITAIAMDKLGWDGTSRLNEVARLNLELRDRAIFHNIISTYNQGKNPFVVYGGSHVVCLEPALKAYVG